MEYQPSEARPGVPLAFQAAFPFDNNGNCSHCGCPWLRQESNARTAYCDESCDCHG